MKVSRRTAAGILIAGLLFTAGVLLRGFLMANFVKPIALLLWSISRLFSSIDQTSYWAGLILLLILVSLWRLSKQPAITEVKRPGNGNATLNSIRYWRSLIAVTRGKPEGPNFLKRSLEALLKDLSASRQPARVSWKSSEDQEEDAIVVPDSIRAFLDLDPPESAQPERARRSQKPRGHFFWRWKQRSQEDYYQSIEEVISFMEKQLEDEDAR